MEGIEPWVRGGLDYCTLSASVTVRLPCSHDSMKRRIAELPLHGGKAPPWLFKRMARLAGAVTMAIVDEHGPETMLERLSDPWWFQAFGCVLGFDWHSSGLTTVTCGALKEAAKLYGDDLGILVAGGKGGTSRKTPDEIAVASDRHAITNGDRLIHASRISAKVDSSAVQDGFQVYHHSFVFTPKGGWCVVQQGMNTDHGQARRYHWHGATVDDFVCEPHAALHDGSDTPSLFEAPLNMVAREAEASREASTALVRDEPDLVLEAVDRATEGPTLFAPRHHWLLPSDVNSARLRKIVRDAHEHHPADFETLLGTPGVGPATVRSLALLAELIYDTPACREDVAAGRRYGEKRWADYAYAHGGKDGTPFPVDRATYDINIAVLTNAVRKARLGITEKSEALKRLVS